MSKKTAETNEGEKLGAFKNENTKTERQRDKQTKREPRLIGPRDWPFFETTSRSLIAEYLPIMITCNFNFKVDGNMATKGFPGEEKGGEGDKIPKDCLNLTFHDVNHMQGGGINPPSVRRKTHL